MFVESSTNTTKDEGEEEAYAFTLNEGQRAEREREREERVKGVSWRRICVRHLISACFYVICPLDQDGYLCPHGLSIYLFVQGPHACPREFHHTLCSYSVLSNIAEMTTIDMSTTYLSIV